MLIKCVAAALVTVLACLLGSNHLTAILMWPLHHVGRTITPKAEVPVLLGTNLIGKLPASAFAFPAGVTNQTGTLRIVAVPAGSNYTLTAEFDSAPLEIRSGIPTIKSYDPLDPIMVALKLALYGGLILASPLLLFFIGQFVLPALKVNEKKILYRAVAFGSVLFFIGVAFCYFLVAGVALFATVQFAQWMGFGADEWRAKEYITFMCRFMLGMGVAFELPVVILTLVKIELLSYEQLVRFRSYAIVGNMVVAAFVTPTGDPFTMLLMAVPLQFLYELSVGVAWYWRRKERQQAALGEPA